VSGRSVTRGSARQYGFAARWSTWRLDRTARGHHGDRREPGAHQRHRGALHRLRAAGRAPRQAVAPRPAVVHEQRPDCDACRRGPRGHQRRQPGVVAHRHRRRGAHRHLLHGGALGAGPPAGAAADDPVPPAVRLHGRSAGVAVRVPAVRGFQHLQHDPVRGRPQDHGARQLTAVDRRRDGAGRGRRDRGLRLHPPDGAVSRLRVPAVLRRPHRGGAAAALPLGRLRPRRFQAGAVPAAVLRGRRLPDQLGHLRLGLLALPAARRHRAQDVPVDLLGLWPGRDLDHVHRLGTGRVGRRRLRHDRVDQRGR